MIARCVFILGAAVAVTSGCARATESPNGGHSLSASADEAALGTACVDACPGSLVCARTVNLAHVVVDGGVCLKPCSQESDRPLGHTCAWRAHRSPGGACERQLAVAPVRAGDAQLARLEHLGVDTLRRALGRTCRTSADCLAGLRCRDWVSEVEKTCEFECVDGARCPSGTYCIHIGHLPGWNCRP